MAVWGEVCKVVWVEPPADNTCVPVLLHTLHALIISLEYTNLTQS